MLNKFQRDDSAQFPSISSEFLRSQNNSLATAKFLGTLGASSSPVRLRLNGKLTRNDRVDFFRTDVAPGASFSAQTDSGNIKGGRIRITSYLQFPGQPLTRIRTEVYSPGSYSEEFNSPFSNTFGITFQVYTEVRSLSRNKTVTYRSQSLFR